MVAFVRDTVQAVDVRSSAWAVRSVVPDRPDQRALLGRVTTPVLVVAGCGGRDVPADRDDRDGRGHSRARPSRCSKESPTSPALENPSLVNTLIEQFVFPG